MVKNIILYFVLILCFKVEAQHIEGIFGHHRLGEYNLSGFQTCVHRALERKIFYKMYFARRSLVAS